MRGGVDWSYGGRPRQCSLAIAVSTLVFAAWLLLIPEAPDSLHRSIGHTERRISGLGSHESTDGDSVSSRLTSAIRKRHQSGVEKRGVMSRCPPPLACENTCQFANDGKCDDGSTLARDELDFSEIEILCDLGTDCNDCGELPTSLSDPKLPYTEYSEPVPEICQPVSYLRSFNISLRRESPLGVVYYENSPTPIYLRRTMSKPTILLAYTDWKTDVDVSSEMHNEQMIEPRVTRVAAATTEECCTDESKLMLDIGSNFGYYAFLSARQGCRVEAWEPVPTFRAFLLIGLFTNGLGNLINLHASVAGSKGGEEIKMTVPTVGIWGTAGVAGMNIDRAIDDPGKYEIVVWTERVGDSVPDDVGEICLVKLDVEGYEPEVYEGGLRELFDPKNSHQIQNLLIEYNVGVYERNQKWKETYKFPMILWDLLKKQYTLRFLQRKGEIDDSLRLMKQAVAEGKGDSVKYELLPFDEVGKSMVARDIGETARYYAGKHFAFGWEAHPMCLRSAISYNTDLWAATSAVSDHYPIGGPAGLTPEDDTLGVLDTICGDLRRIGPAAEIKGRICMTQAEGHAEVFRQRVADAVQEELAVLPQCSEWLSKTDMDEIQELLRNDLNI